MKIIILLILLGLSFIVPFHVMGQRPEDRPSLYEIEVNSKFGYIDKSGRIAIQPTLNQSFQFREGLADFKQGEKCGYKDATLRVAIAPEFDECDRFSEGMAAIKIQDKWGYIDKQGHKLIEPKFDFAFRFSEGYARINDGMHFGFIDRSGRIVINYQFDDVGDFSEGLASFAANRKMGYIDKTGKVIIKPQFEWAADFHSGVAAVMNKQRAGYIDKTGEILIPITLSLPPIIFTTITGISIVGDTPKKQKYISNPGLVDVDWRFQEEHSFHDGLVLVLTGRKFGFMDKTGKMVIAPRFDSANPFSEGLAAVSIDGMAGYIDKSGKFSIKPEYDTTWSFEDGLAKVFIDDKQGYIDKTGKLIWGPGIKEALENRRAEIAKEKQQRKVVPKEVASTAREAITALRKLSDAFDQGMDRDIVRAFVIEARTEVDRAILKLPDGDLKTEILQAMQNFSDADQSLDRFGDSYGGKWLPVDPASDVWTKEIARRYFPDLLKGPGGLVPADVLMDKIFNQSAWHMKQISSMVD